MKNNEQNTDLLPFVSICTPTFNRRPFIPTMIQCFQNQTYPKNRIEWIIIDDGTDKIGDLVDIIPQVKYFPYHEKMTLGKKRNLMNEKSSGSIIVYMDDDDYYPPERISHAVETLQNNPLALCAGSSEMYIYFKQMNIMYKFGPYGPKHATAATFAFRRELLNETTYDENVCLAEEKHFLKNYTIPLVQLDPLKTILVFSHNHNSFDKKILLENPNQYINVSDKKVDDFVKESDIYNFFMVEIDNLLEEYEPGNPKYKPDVMKQMEEIKTKREKIIEEENKKRSIYEKISKKSSQNQSLDNSQTFVQQTNMIQELLKENEKLKEKINYLENKMRELITTRINELKNSK